MYLYGGKPTSHFHCFCKFAQTCILGCSYLIAKKFTCHMHNYILWCVMMKKLRIDAYTKVEVQKTHFWDIYWRLLVANNIVFIKTIYSLDRYVQYLKPYFFLCHLTFSNKSYDDVKLWYSKQKKLYHLKLILKY